MTLQHTFVSASNEHPPAARLALAANELRDQVIDLACQLCETPAPTNDEWRRSELVASLMPGLGFTSVQRDDIGDVTGVIPGQQSERTLLLAAHLDTVFPLETPLIVKRVGERVFGPGIGDNCLGLAAAMMLPSVLHTAQIDIESDIVVTGNVGEEGLGNLRGIRAVLDAWNDVKAVVAIEGHNLGRVTNIAVGSRRLRVVITGPGGHSWGDAGKPSAIHAGSELIAQLSRLRLQSFPKTTLNVGTISGGISVNTIAPDMSFVIDLRSVEEQALQSLEQRVREVLRRTPRGINVEISILGDRPAGNVSSESAIVQHAWTVLRGLGVEPTADASSTDANIPISRGIPAICIGLTNGGNVHRVDEYIDIPPVAAGLYQLTALSVQIAADLASGCLIQ